MEAFEELEQQSLINIRIATREDIDSVMEINNKFTYNWTRDKFEDLFNCEAQFVIMEDQGEIIGYIAYTIFLDEARILNVVVNPDHQGSGFGEQLMRYALNDIKSRQIEWTLLDVSVRNIKAIGLYTKLDFKILCRRRNYYAIYDGADAYFMQLGV